MISEIINDIIMYIELLKSYGIRITIHFSTDKFSSLMYAFSKYNIHSNSFCSLIKLNPEAWKHCVARQEKIYVKLKEGAYWGMCYAGVEEYVFPLKYQEIFGFISVSGYAEDEKKALPRIRRVSEQYQITLVRLQEAYRNLNHKKPDFRILSAIIKPLCHMLVHAYAVLPNAAEGRGSGPQNMVSEMIEYIHRHYADKITLSDLCAQCNVSGSTVSHNFKRLTGYSVREYITLVRMTNAKILLMNTTLSIGEIAELVGYEDSNYFTNSFHRMVGVPPHTFRNK